MQQQKRTLRTTRSRWRYLASVGLGALIVLFVVQQASAGPITNPGGAPYAKLSVYQGVLSIVPNGSGDSVMEIGNAGRDIKSTGDINITPTGDVHITTGRLCFGTGTSSCSNTWGAATTWTLDAVLAAGNSTARNAAIGAVVTPMSKLAVNNGTSGTGGAGDSITSYGNTRCMGGTRDGQICSWDTDCYSWPSPYVQCVGSALYAEQANNNQNSGASGPTATHDGYAGYFSGRVMVRPAGVTPLQYNGYDWARYYSGTTMTVQGNVPFWNGESLYVYNQNVNGLAARIFGGVEIGAGATSLVSHGDPQAALSVYNDGQSTLYGNNGIRVITADGISSFGVAINTGNSPNGGTSTGLSVSSALYSAGHDNWAIKSYGDNTLRSLMVGITATHPGNDQVLVNSVGTGAAVHAIQAFPGGGGSAGLFEGSLLRKGYNSIGAAQSVATLTPVTTSQCGTVCTNSGMTCAFAVVTSSASISACNVSVTGFCACY